MNLLLRIMVMLTSLLGLVSCSAIQPALCTSDLRSAGRGRDLAFTTIELGSASSLLGEAIEIAPLDYKTALRIIAVPEDISDVEQFISSHATEALKQLDYTTHFAIVASGSSLSNSSFCMTKLSRQGHEVSIYTQLVEFAHGPAVRYFPYHIVQIPKEEAWNDEFTFNLLLYMYDPQEMWPIRRNQGVVTSVSHFIP